MDVMARMSSKGQITVPKAVREALELSEGDSVVFRLQGGRAVVARTPDLLDLAGAVPTPASARTTSWEDVRRAAHAHAARRSA